VLAAGEEDARLAGSAFPQFELVQLWQLALAAAGSGFSGSAGWFSSNWFRSFAAQPDLLLSLTGFVSSVSSSSMVTTAFAILAEAAAGFVLMLCWAGPETSYH